MFGYLLKISIAGLKGINGSVILKKMWFSINNNINNLHINSTMGWIFVLSNWNGCKINAVKLVIA